jgi:antitoxin (DNA-binding transcriptional repressor) of toxin-antitoxin stability system
MRMGLREANQNFSKAIKAIKAGKAIVLTERGKPIATITPIVDERTGDDELQPLRDEGFLIGRRKRGLVRAQARPHAIGRVSASDILRRERNED